MRAPVAIAIELHDEIKKRCDSNDLFMYQWVEEVLRTALAVEKEIERAGGIVEELPGVLAPSVDKLLSTLRPRLADNAANAGRVERRYVAPPKDPRDPWTRPPFWKAAGYKPTEPGPVRKSKNQVDEDESSGAGFH